MLPAPDNYQDNLEFPALLEMLSAYCAFSGGRREIRQLAPLHDPEPIARLHCLVQELQRRFAAGDTWSCPSVENASGAVARVQVEGLDLEVKEILQLQDLAETSARTRRFLSTDSDLFPELAALGRLFPSLEMVVAYVAERIDPDGGVPDRASPELASVRRELRNVGDRIQSEYQRLLDVSQKRGILQDRFVTSRNNRFVIPIRSESQGALGGVVHGSSSSGLTVFMEPFELVSLNNSHIRLKEREEEIIQRILAQISAFLRSRKADLESAFQLLAKLDGLAARARFALEYHGVAPTVDSSRVLVLEDARHPLLERSLKAQGKQIVAISLSLTPREPRLIISGPNTGGKTAAIKCAGLLTLMALSGIPVPARHMECAPFHAVQAVIGDRQSLSNDLSTFSSHILLLKGILDQYRPPSLVLVDELCAGTDPAEGGALATAILDYLRDLGAPFIVTTHSRTLKEYSVKTPGTAVAAVEFDPATLQPTYRLHAGALGGSSGLFIARRLGLPEVIVHAAESHLASHEGHFEETCERINELVKLREREVAEAQRIKHEQILKKIELERRAEERKQEELQRIRREYDRMRTSFAENQARLSEEFRRLAEQARPVDRFESRSERLERQFTQEMETLLGPAEESGPPPQSLTPIFSSELREGVTVHVGPLHRTGVVQTTSSGEIGVIVEGKRLAVPPDWLFYPPPQDNPPPTSSTSATSSLAKTPELTESVSLPPSPADTLLFPRRELILIGKTVDEALPEAEKFLDSAYRDEERCIAIIHGIGKGILRAALQQKLREIPFVKSFHHPPGREGGKGKTIVILEQ